MAEIAKGIIDIEINSGNAAQQLKVLQSQINAFNLSLNSSARDQSQFANKLAKDLEFAVNRTQLFTAETIKLSTAAATLDKTLSKGKTSLGQFFSAKFNKDSAIAAETMALAAERAKRMQTQFIATSGSVKGFQNALAIRPLTELSSEISVASQRTQILSTMFKQGTTQLINFGKNVQWAGRQLMVGFTVPLTIFGNTAAKTFTDLEQAAIRFKRVYGDLFTTEQETARALKGIDDLARSYTKYNIAVKDTINLAADLAAAGYQGAKLNEAVAQTNRLATLGNIDQQKSMQTIIALQNAFEISSRELAGTIDYLNSVENQTVVSLDDITEAVPRVAPVIKGLGGDVRDLTVFLAAMEEGGVSAEQGANALKSGLASLINPTKTATETLAGFGINLQQIVDTNRGNLMATVTGLGQALATLSDFQKQQAIEAIFGKYQFARLGALFTNIVKEGSQANQVLQLANQSAIELAYTANRELSVVENAVSNKFRAAIEDLKVSIAPIGEIFLKVSIPVLNFIEKIVEKFNGLSEGRKQFIAIATIITGVVIPAGTMFFGLLMNLVGTLLKLSQGFGAFAKGFITGGPLGAIRALTQSSKYLSLSEIDAAMAAQQLSAASQAVNAALLEQAGAAGVAQNAINGLNRAYLDTIATQSRMTALPGFGIAGNAGQKAKKYSSGVVSVPGSGNRDTVPAMLTPGEAVIPADMAKKYAPLINGMISNSIPGYSDGLFTPTDPRSQKILNEARNVASSINGVSEILENALIGFEKTISPKALSNILKNDPVLQLLSSSTETKGRSTGSSGLVKMHVGSGGTPVSNISEIKDILTVEQFQKISQANNVRLLDNLVFAGPAAGNRGQLTGLEFSNFISNNPKQFMGQLAAQSGVNVEHPDFTRFANNVSQQMALAGSRAIGESEFDNIIQSAISQEINNVAKNTAIEVKSAFEEARKISTVSYAVKNSSGENITHRANIPKFARGMDISIGGENMSTTSQKPYRQIPITSGGHKINDDFIKKTISERLKNRIDLIEKEIVNGVITSTKQASPSKEAEDAGKNIGRGAIIGIESQTDDAKIAGEKLASNMIVRDKRASQQSGAISGSPTVVQQQQQVVQESIKQKEKENRASSKLSRANAMFSGKIMGASMATSALGGAMMMAGGSVGEFGQKILMASSAAMGISSILPMLASPVGIAVAAVSALAFGVYKLVEAQKKAEKEIRDAASKQAESMTGSATAVSDFAKAIGKEGLLGSKQKTGLTSEQSNIFYQALNSPEMAKTLAGYTEAQSAGNLAKVASEDLLAMAVNFDMTAGDIQSYTEAIAKATGIGNAGQLEIRSKLIELLYDDPTQKKNLLDDPSINIDINARLKEMGPTAASDLLVKQARSVIGSNQIGNLLSQQRIDIANYIKNQNTTVPPRQGGPTNTFDAEGAQRQQNARQFQISILSNADAVTNMLRKSSEQLSIAEQKLNSVYAEGSITIDEYNKKAQEINDSRKLLNDTFDQQIQVLSKNKDALKQYAATQNEVFNIRLDASGMNDALKGRVKAFMDSIKNEEVKLKAQFIYENSGMSPEEFLTTVEQIKGFFPDSEMQTKVLASMVENNISIDKLDQYLAILNKMPESVRTKYLLDGEITREAAYAIAAASMTGNGGRALREGTPEDAVSYIMSYAKSIMNGLSYTPPPPGKGGTGKTGNDVNDGGSSGGGSAQKTLADYMKEIQSATQQQIKYMGVISSLNNVMDIEAAGMLDQTFLLQMSNEQRQQAISLMRQQMDVQKALAFLSQTSDERMLSSLQLYVKIYDLQSDKYDKVIEGLQREIQLEQRQIDIRNKALEELSLREEAINEAYNERIKVLEDVSKANNRIANQEKNRIDLASALASGDIAAAASITSSITQQNAQNQIEDARAELEKKREEDLKNLKVEVNGVLMTRKEIEDSIRLINNKIYDLNQKILVQEDALYAIQQKRNVTLDQIKKLEYQILLYQQAQTLEALKRSGLTGQALDDLNAQIALYNELAKVAGVAGISAPIVGAATAGSGTIGTAPAPTGGTVLSDTEFVNNILKPTVSYGPGSEQEYIAKQLGYTGTTASYVKAATMVTRYSPLSTSEKQRISELVLRAASSSAKAFANGGIVPGFGNKDTVSAMLTPGEFVVKKKEANKNMSLLKMINSGIFPKLGQPTFSLPTQASSVAKDATKSVSAMYNDTYNINVNVAGTNASPDDIANVVMNKISNMNSGRVRGIRYNA